MLNIPRARRLMLRMLLLFMLRADLCLSAHAARAQSVSDYQAEAAYLYNFAKLAEWPRSSLPAGAPLTIGVVGGNNDFVQVLQKTVAGKSVRTHAVEVKHLAITDNLKSCNVLFFRASERKHVQEAVASLHQTGILLVGEDKLFLQQGGMANLVLREGVIRLEIDPDALAGSGIRFDQEVLKRAWIEHVSPASSTGPRKIAVRVTPDYPQLAQRMNLRGTVQVEAVVAPDGTVKKVKLVGGHPVLAQAALQAVLKWKYEPAREETIELVKVTFGSED